MRKLTLVVSVLLLCFALSTALLAGDSYLTSTTTAEKLFLECSWVRSTAGAGLWDLTYTLTNQTTTDYIRGFTLALPDGAPVTALSIFVTPATWNLRPLDIPNNKVQWEAQTELAPTASVSFGFTAPWEPAAQTTLASAQNAHGFSGYTCGPAIPEASTVMLALMGLSTVAGFRKLYSRR